MKSMKAGDVFFLYRSNIATSKQMGKEMLNALGVLPECPVIILREVYHWDSLKTVTVVPCIADYEGPYIEFTFINRNGDRTENVYKAIPHMIQTIPVSRLGRYIGSLSDTELYTVKNHCMWCVGSGMDKESAGQYRELSIRYLDAVNSAASLRRARVVNKWVEVTTSDEFPWRDGQSNGNTAPREQEDETKETPEAGNTHPKYPDSYFSTEILDRYASRFTIADKYYDGSVETRDPNILTEEEIHTIRDVLPAFRYETVRSIYTKLEPIDAFLYVVWITGSAVAKMLDIPYEEASCLKRLATYMKNMPEDVYKERLRGYENRKKEHDVNAKTAAACEHIRNSIGDRREMKETLAALKPILTESGMLRIPQKYSKKFLEIPKHMVRPLYQGKKFDEVYAAACERCARLSAE